MKNLKVTALGTGTSSGVPLIGCKCEVCTSNNPKDKRLRCSILIESHTTTLVIDTSSDFRQQMLKYNVSKLDGVLFTHHHNDHISGFDDIRAFNFIHRKPIPIFLTKVTLTNLERIFSYAFGRYEQIGGGIPEFEVNIIDNDKIEIGDITLEPIKLMHGNMEVLGFRIGNFAYCTDTNYISEESLEKLQGLDIFILDSLRDKPLHPTHYTINESLKIVEIIKPKKTYFTHIAHQLLHDKTNLSLPKNVELAFDGQVFEFTIN
jgi:phosphoribosyl 1,2-cyclic phosphate phosphodiesterase